MKCPVIMKGRVTPGNAVDVLKCLPDKSVDLVVTSPPYAQKRKKQYGGIDSSEYSSWFTPVASEIARVLKDDGSFVLNIKEHVENGERSDYVHETIKAIRGEGFRWNDTYIWHKTNPYPVKPVGRFKDAFENVYHFTKQKEFKFYPDEVKIPGKTPCSTYRHESGTRKSKVNRYRNFSSGFIDTCSSGMVYPGNVLTMAVNSRSNGHPASFPEAIPRFFIKLLSKPGDVVLDPFAGSGTTNVAAKKAGRDTIGIDVNHEYVKMANERLDGVKP